MCLSSSRTQRGEVFSWFPSHEIDSSKKEERRKERQRGVFVMLDEIMLFVCYTSS